MKTAIFDGVRVVSTTELCERIGLKVSSTDLKELNLSNPVAETSTGIYWKEDHVPLFAMAIAERLIRIASNLQLVSNINREQR